MKDFINKFLLFAFFSFTMSGCCCNRDSPPCAKPTQMESDLMPYVSDQIIRLVNVNDTSDTINYKAWVSTGVFEFCNDTSDDSRTGGLGGCACIDGCGPYISAYLTDTSLIQNFDDIKYTYFGRLQIYMKSKTGRWELKVSNANGYIEYLNVNYSNQNLLKCEEKDQNEVIYCDLPTAEGIKVEYSNINGIQSLYYKDSLHYERIN